MSGLSKKLNEAINDALRAPDGEGYAHDGVVQVDPSQAQLDVAFKVARAAINTLVGQLVPPWALNMVHITDQEVRVVSDRVTKAVVNTKGA